MPDSAPAGRTPAQVAGDFLAAFYTGDFTQARELVTDDFAFRGPFLQVDGGDAFFSGAQGLKNVVRGHRTVRQWEDGLDVLTLYEVKLETPAGAGVVLMSEWHTVRDGRLASGRVVFDTAAFRALLPAQPQPQPQ